MFKYISAFLFLTFLTGMSLLADGFIVIPRPFPVAVRPIIDNPFPLEVAFHHVDVKINDLSATTYIDQEFYNPTSMRLEGFYIFPKPKGSVIKKFTMFIDGKETEAELLDAEKARKIYTDIVRSMKDPALLEYDGQDIFKVRIFPIEPRSTKRIKISYSQILQKDDGTIEYSYPLNTEKFSAKPLKNVKISVEIKSADTLKNIYSPTHNVEISRKNDQSATASYEAKDIKPENDFSLYFSTDKSKIGLSLLTFREKEEDGFFFLNASPGISVNDNEISEKDITFVLDVSGSMVGEKLTQAKKALLFCASNLGKKDRFQIIRFSTEAESLFDNLMVAEESNLAKARSFINGLKAIGGTHIEEALDMALKAKTDDKRPHMVIFITDGKPTIGETNEDLLISKIERRNIRNTRIFTFGIGEDINTHLLDKITELTKAYRVYIAPDEDIEIKISNFYNKVQSPVMTNITLTFDSNIKVLTTYPAALPDLFKGSSISMLGRYRGSAKNANITLKGRINNREISFPFKADFLSENKENEQIAPLWAARRIGFLLDYIRLHGENGELKDEITILARKFGIVTPYTSFLILEDEKGRVERREIRPEDQTIGGFAPRMKAMEEEGRSEFSAMKSKSGNASIRASKELQSLNQADNLMETKQGEKRMSFKDESGNQANVTAQIRNVQGRAFYNHGKVWIDSKIQNKPQKNILRIKFATDAYFQLIEKHPESGEILSLETI